MFVRVTSAENGKPMVLNVGFIRAVTHCDHTSIYPSANTQIIFAYSREADRALFVEERPNEVWSLICAALKPR